ncbi:hypothetical protein QEH59_17575 [Coraliomargarita sp. SDUM461004]|uniref:Secreted protein n=1 Tax=Thalassobacterium sedimentorum TaxID=3041258 RepID=A0ABU1ANI8_9BACT|nr:hypothetical protein [Coraliomargarita sp. SDUM461004]MDQ8196249.1 hypothetical protein [Coraliomargarita sp. SDUM461004]
MKTNKIYFFLMLGLLAAVYGVSQSQSLSTDLLACCDPEVDEECEPDPDPDPDPDGDSMPTQFLS